MSKTAVCPGTGARIAGRLNARPVQAGMREVADLFWEGKLLHEAVLLLGIGVGIGRDRNGRCGRSGGGHYTNYKYEYNGSNTFFDPSYCASHHRAQETDKQQAECK